MSYPKSCLKRGSISSTASDSSPNTSPRQPYCMPDFALAQSPPSILSTNTSSSSLPSSSSVTSSVSRPRRKSVTFCEDNDVMVFYPPPVPLHKQAKRAASRLFRACADALRIEPYEFPSEEEYMRQEYGDYSPESPCFLGAFANVHIHDAHAPSHR